MTVTIRGPTENVGLKVIIIVIVLVVVITGLILLWIYIVTPILGDISGGDGTADCTSAPVIPSGLSSNVVDNSVTLAWTQTPSTDSYRVYMSQSSSFDINFAERVVDVVVPSATIPNLLPTTYYFKVSAFNSCGNSQPSPEISQTVSSWPETLKICKEDSPTVCLSLSSTPGQPAKVSLACPSNNCDLTYTGTEIALAPDETICIEENDQVGPDIESIVTGETCSGQNWNISLSSGRIFNSSGLCLGANNSAESNAFNTDCSLLAPTDARYLWTVQPI